MASSRRSRSTGRCAVAIQQISRSSRKGARDFAQRLGEDDLRCGARADQPPSPVVVVPSHWVTHWPCVVVQVALQVSSLHLAAHEVSVPSHVIVHIATVLLLPAWLSCGFSTLAVHASAAPANTAKIAMLFVYRVILNTPCCGFRGGQRAARAACVRAFGPETSCDGPVPLCGVRAALSRQPLRAVYASAEPWGGAPHRKSRWHEECVGISRSRGSRRLIERRSSASVFSELLNASAT